MESNKKCELHRNHSENCLLDQQLYWGMPSCYLEAPYTDESSGDYSYIDGGNGLKDISDKIFEGNAGVHIMSLQRALCEHLLLDQCLTDKIISKLIDSEPEIESLIQELKQLYCEAENGEIKIAWVRLYGKNDSCNRI